MLNTLPYINHLDSGNFFIIAGPCVLEDREMGFDICSQIKRITDRLRIPYIFKASYKKANRSRLDSFTGIGDDEALSILGELRRKISVSVLTDIHSPDEAEMASIYVDILQIPAFLCRQTDLITAAAKTDKIVNIKKGQFVSPESMKFAVDKVVQSGNDKVMLTERGSMFGYHDFVVDFRGVQKMKENGCPVILDITHSLQQPNQSSGVSGGQPEMIETIAKAGIAAGVDGIFIETHPNPADAKSDGANMLPLDQLEGLLRKLVRIRQAVISL